MARHTFHKTTAFEKKSIIVMQPNARVNPCNQSKRIMCAYRAKKSHFQFSPWIISHKTWAFEEEHLPLAQAYYMVFNILIANINSKIRQHLQFFPCAEEPLLSWLNGKEKKSILFSLSIYLTGACLKG